MLGALRRDAASSRSMQRADDAHEENDKTALLFVLAENQAIPRAIGFRRSERKEASTLFTARARL